MPSIPCPKVITCPGAQGGAANVLDADSPIGNFSSELPDQILFTATGFPIWNPENPLDPAITGNDPSFPPLYFAEGCVGPAFSSLSQDDANAIAARQAIQCEYNKQKPTPGLFFNAAQQCSFTCPDGSLYTFTVEPGFVVAGSQSLADTIANTIACERAAADYICLGSLTPSTGCFNQPYSGTISLLSKNPPIGVSISIGSLPPGLALSESIDGKTATISGTPTSPGNFSFGFHATDAQGNFHDKMFTIEVLGITNIVSLGHPMVNRPYSAQLTAQGGIAPYTFSAPNGGFPTGLSMNSSGLISGTPSVHYTGAFAVDFTVVDANGLSCTQRWNSSVDEPPGPDWTKLVWDTYTLKQNPPNDTVSGSAAGPNTSGTIKKSNGGFFPEITPVHAGGLSYTGAQITGRITRIITDATGGVEPTVSRVLVNAVPVVITPSGSNPVFPALGTYNFTFIIPASVGAAITLDDASPGNVWAGVAQAGVQGSFAFSWQIYNT